MMTMLMITSEMCQLLLLLVVVMVVICCLYDEGGTRAERHLTAVHAIHTLRKMLRLRRREIARDGTGHLPPFSAIYPLPKNYHCGHLPPVRFSV